MGLTLSRRHALEVWLACAAEHTQSVVPGMARRPQSSFVKPSDNLAAADEEIAVLNRFYSTRILVSTTTLIFAAGLTFIVYHSAPMLGQQKAATTSQKSVAGVTVTLTVDGMTCAACAKGLAATLRKAPGVIASQVDYDKRQATITYDPDKQSAESFKTIVRQSGYTCK
jgi:copper chaperone CopZ